jgi:hypothetical protein
MESTTMATLCGRPLGPMATLVMLGWRSRYIREHWGMVECQSQKASLS